MSLGDDTKKKQQHHGPCFFLGMSEPSQSRPEPPVGAWSSYFPGVCCLHPQFLDISLVIPWHVIFFFSPPYSDSVKFRPTQVVSWLYHVISYPIPTLEQIISWGLVVRIWNSHHSPCLLISLSPCCSAWPQFCCLSENGRFQAENDRSISALVSGKACRTTATKPEWSWSESQIYGFPMFSHVFPMCLSLVSHVFFSGCLWCSSVCSMVLNLQLYFFLDGFSWFFEVFPLVYQPVRAFSFTYFTYFFRNCDRCISFNELVSWVFSSEDRSEIAKVFHKKPRWAPVSTKFAREPWGFYWDWCNLM